MYHLNHFQVYNLAPLISVLIDKSSILCSFNLLIHIHYLLPPPNPQIFIIYGIASTVLGT